MSCIIIHHFLYHCITPSGLPSQLYNLINPWFFTGVNIFFLLSGWFTIRFSLKKIVMLVLLIWLYNMLNVAGCNVMGESIMPDNLLMLIFFPVAQSPYWFLQIYLALMIIAPIINLGMSAIEINLWRKIIVLLTFFVIYSCNMGLNGSFNKAGPDLLLAIYMYVLGNYIRSDKKLYDLLSPRICWVGFVLCTVLTSVATAFVAELQFLGEMYSLPLICASVLFFIGMSKLHFKSRIVNILGAASLGCYMLQDGLFGNTVIYPKMHWQWLHGSGGSEIWLIFIALFFGYWLLALIINPIFRFVSERIATACCRLLWRIKNYFTVRPSD